MASALLAALLPRTAARSMAYAGDDVAAELRSAARDRDDEDPVPGWAEASGEPDRAPAGTARRPSQTAASGGEYLSDARKLFEAKQYFKAARYAFAAQEADERLAPEAYGWMALSLGRARMYNAAAYFFIRTLQSGSKSAIRRVLPLTPELMLRVGSDLLRKYLIRHTAYDDYSAEARGAYLYALGKDALLSGKLKEAVGYLDGVGKSNALWPYAMLARGTAHAIAKNEDAALRDFESCAEEADSIGDRADGGQGSGTDLERKLARQLEREADDLKSRCLAGRARTFYQADRFDEAERAWDQIPKSSLVWPDILFEQAWNAFAKGEYNRTLGKLVSYKAPALTFVFNTEVEVLRAHTFLMLCLYDDANTAINDFNARYGSVGEQVKKFVEANASNLRVFWDFGKAALKESLYTRDERYRMANRFLRGPYFQSLASAERDVMAEGAVIARFNLSQPGASRDVGRGFPGFLNQVLKWRLKSVRVLGGVFVKNSLMDHHGSLIADFEKMAFIKLEMLSRAKDKLLKRPPLASEGDRGRGLVAPTRQNYQYFWTFNGEFWNDELGDYVFGLESECERARD